MTGPNRMDDFKRIWQGQSTEETKLTLEEVRDKARSFQSLKRIVGFVMLPFSIGMTIFFSRFLLRASTEHRPGGLLLIPIGVCLYCIYVSVLFIHTRRMARDASFRTSLQVYRAHFEGERAFTPIVWSLFGLIMLASAIAAVDLWFQSPVFPIWDAVEFGIGYILIGVIVFLGIRHKNREIDRALRIVDGLEHDVE